jgi:hypothetical protein
MRYGQGRLLVRLTVLAPLAAAVAIGTAPSPVTSSKHAVTAVLLGSGIATAAFLVVDPDLTLLGFRIALVPAGEPSRSA